MVERSHIDGKFETVKFARRREDYYENLVKILDLGHTKTDFIHYFPAFAGDLTLNRYLTLHAFYKMVFGIAGHCAEVGVYKGATSIFFGKLIRMYEPDSLTMTHGFDNFGGTRAVDENPLQVEGGNKADEKQLRELISLQHLDNIVKIHNVDVEKDLPTFFNSNPHLRFKMVFLDSGTYECTAASIESFWPRLNPGGVMIFDQYNNEVAPGETRAVHDLLPGVKIETLPGSWMPSAFVRKL